MNTNVNTNTNTNNTAYFSPDMSRKQAILNIADRMAGAAQTMSSQGYEELISAREELKAVCLEWQQEIDTVNSKLVKIKEELNS